MTSPKRWLHFRVFLSYFDYFPLQNIYLLTPLYASLPFKRHRVSQFSPHFRQIVSCALLALSKILQLLIYNFALSQGGHLTAFSVSHCIWLPLITQPLFYKSTLSFIACSISSWTLFLHESPYSSYLSQTPIFPAAWQLTEVPDRGNQSRKKYKLWNPAYSSASSPFLGLRLPGSCRTCIFILILNHSKRSNVPFFLLTQPFSKTWFHFYCSETSSLEPFPSSQFPFSICMHRTSGHGVDQDMSTTSLPSPFALLKSFLQGSHLSLLMCYILARNRTLLPKKEVLAHHVEQQVSSGALPRATCIRNVTYQV